MQAIFNKDGVIRGSFSQFFNNMKIIKKCIYSMNSAFISVIFSNFYINNVLKPIAVWAIGCVYTTQNPFSSVSGYQAEESACKFRPEFFTKPVKFIEAYLSI